MGAMIDVPDIGDARFHHIGVACHDLDREQRAFSLMGYRTERADFFDPIQGVHGRFLIGGGPRLELLRNDTERGPLTPWLTQKIKFYHLAFETDDLEERVSHLVRSGAKVVVKPVPAVAFDGRVISFLMLPNVSLIELIQC